MLFSEQIPIGFKEKSTLCSKVIAFREKKLTATEQEQKLWKELQNLKEKQEKTQNPDLEKRIDKLECEISAIQGKDITAIEAENITLRKKAIAQEKELLDLRKRYAELRKVFGSLGIGDQKKTEAKTENESKLAKMLLRKYAQTINEKETKTVGEIKELVNKKDLTIQAIIQDLKPENYNFEKDYLQTAEKVLEYLNEEIEYAKADFGINFWLEPKEILEAGVSDDEDLAVMLCSALFELGDDKAQVVITELDNLTTHAIVITEHKGNFYILDPSQKHHVEKFAGKKETALAEFEFKNAKIKRFLYKFNAENYEQFL